MNSIYDKLDNHKAIAIEWPTKANENQTIYDEYTFMQPQETEPKLRYSTASTYKTFWSKRVEQKQASDGVTAMRDNISDILYRNAEKPIRTS